MELVKEVKGTKIYKKRSGRFGVKAENGNWINGDEKVKLLLSEGLIKAAAPKAKVEETPVETAAEAPAQEVTEEKGE